jgi:Acetyltransferase (GNAT) family
MITITTGDRGAAFAAGMAAYGRTSHYVPPLWSDFDRMLDPARNPLVTEGHGRFELFTALRDGQPVGRIVACLHDASNTRFGLTRAQFGFFDCIDDNAVAAALLTRAEAWALERGATTIAGNFNLTAMQQVGVMTEGFDRPAATDMIWNAPHIARLLEANGYRAIFPMTTFEIDLRAGDTSGLLGPKQQEILADTSLAWMPISRTTFRQRLEEARVVLNDGFANNPMFVPPTHAEFMFQAGEMLWVIDRRLSVMVHHEGRPIGAIIIIPDLNPLVKRIGGRIGLTTPWHFLRHRMGNKRAVLIYQSVSRAWQNRGLVGAMLHRCAQALKQAGYETLSTTWVADVNGASLRQVEKAGARPLHRLHLFEKALTP